MNRRWKDLSPRARVAIVVLATIQLSLLLAALIDLRRRPAEEIRGGKKRWVAISFIDFVGPISYFTVGRRR